MKRHLSVKGIVKILVCIISSMALTAECFGAEGRSSSTSTVTTDPYNVMLLIDKSGSMNATDADRLALSAACQFVDQLCTSYSDLSSATNVGVISFSRDAQIISAPISLDSETNTDYLKSEIRNIKYDRSNTGGTDLGIAIYEAAGLLKRQTSTQQKNMIVVFTDGYSENVRDKALSEERLEEALQTANGLSCEIYIVGLNQNNCITEMGKDEIYSIADRAQIGEGIKQAAENDSYTNREMVNYLITDNKKDVSEFYGLIYAKMRGSDINYIDNHKFNITSRDILEVDVMIYSEEVIHDIVLTDPKGRDLEEDGETFIVSEDPYYRVMRILNPDVGTWNIYVETADDSYLSYKVEVYGIEVSVCATWGKAEDFVHRGLMVLEGLEDSGKRPGSIGEVKATLMYKGEQYHEETLIQSISMAQFEVTDSKSGEVLGTWDLDYSSEEGKYLGYFPILENGEYDVTVKIKNDSMERTASYTLTVNDDDPVVPDTFNLDSINIEVGKQQVINIDEAVEPSGIVIQEVVSKFESEDPRQPFSVEYDGNALTISGEEVGSGMVVISVLDEAGNAWTVLGDVNVQEAAATSYSKIFLPLALLLGIIIIAKNKLMHISGDFQISVKISESSDSKYAGQTLERQIAGHPYGRVFSLWRLMEQIIRECQEGEPKEQEICEMLKREKNQIEKRKLVINKGPRKGHRPTYKLKDKDGRMHSLRIPWVYTCCKDFSIRICFIDLMGGNNIQNNNFGKLATATHSKKGRSARTKLKRT